MNTKFTTNEVIQEVKNITSILETIGLDKTERPLKLMNMMMNQMVKSDPISVFQFSNVFGNLIEIVNEYDLYMAGKLIACRTVLENKFGIA